MTSLPILYYALFDFEYEKGEEFEDNKEKKGEIGLNEIEMDTN